MDLKSLMTKGINIAIIGQSNGGQLLYGVGSAPTKSDLVRVLVGERTNDGLAAPDIHWSLNTFQASNSWGISSIASALQATYEAPVRFIHNTKGGSSIADWNAGLKPSEVYGQTLALIQRNLATCNYLVWVHGEQDSYIATTKQAYKDGVKALYKRFLDDLGQTSDALKLVITGVGEVTNNGGAPFATTPNIQAIQDAQVELARDVSGIIYAGDMSDIPTIDGIHFTQNAAGSGAVGQRIGAAILADINASNACGMDKPSFSATKGGVVQTGIPPLSGTTKISYGVEEWDIGGYYDASLSRWTPPKGKYRLTASAVMFVGVVDQEAAFLNIYKNGALHRQGQGLCSGTAIGPIVAVDALVDANGTDYFEVFLYASGAGDKSVGGATWTTYFQGSSI